MRTGMILAKSEIDYFEPIFLEDEVFCYTKITSFGTKSFEISNIISKISDTGEINVAEGKSVIQNIDQIDRGYQYIDTRLQQLGADIKRV